ncbi:MAG: hypothetical protein ACNYPG_04400 [Candidatus Porifericomitaceae bacterium WSBS_2022_MAG_OTU9]
MGFGLAILQGWNKDRLKDGLVVAELELEHPQQAFAKPPWLGREVSEDSRYYNTSLQQQPYSTWEHTD